MMIMHVSTSGGGGDDFVTPHDHPPSISSGVCSTGLRGLGGGAPDSAYGGRRMCGGTARRGETTPAAMAAHRSPSTR
jgi:hypothetical protein